ncbi:NACHT domain-containing protein [Fusarium napiforme]|uniref:NACHT domain-containing protein n=1 Tax=Fusarium napiforme TaxID=42672 RepID=A0A8H5IGE1_9HYPO|nr:NACHT domain-containing protein [Fusarium napiforme]
MPLAPVVNLDARRTIEKAFKDLERTVSASDRISLQDTTLNDVRKAAHLVEDDLAARQSLRNMKRLEPLFTGLEYYSKTIEVLCNGTPYMPWIWAPIKLILKISSDYVEAFEKIIKVYGQIAEPLKRLQKLSRAFYSDKDVQQTLATFYSDILKFHTEAYQFVRRGSWRLLFLTSWGRFQRRFEGIIQDLKAHKELVDKMATATNIAESKELRQKMETWRQEQVDRMAKEETEEITRQYVAITSYLKVDESLNAKVFDAIATEAAESVGTSSWILNQSEIQCWLKYHPSSTFILLHGRPGSGKSVLATQIVQFLQASQQSLTMSHFCTYAYEESMDYDKLLKSLLLQLIRSDKDLIDYVYDMLLSKRKVPSYKLVEALILDSIRASSHDPSRTRYIHVVIDGLDECNQPTQSKVTKLMKRMVSAAFSSGSTICKVMLSSRSSPAITKAAKQSQTVSLSNENKHLEKAIEAYALHRLSLIELELSQLQVTPDDISDLSCRIAKRAEGMFLWARLVLDYLANNMFLQREEVLSAPEALPRALQQFYEKILTQITAHFDERSLERTKLILEWIAFAKRPLRKAEFRSALAFSSGNPDTDELAPQYLFDRCSSLIEERHDSTFAFIHVSVRDYLESSDSIMPIDESSSVVSHGQAIAACLVSGLQIFTPNYPENKRHLRVLRGIHAFHTYASQYWVYYVLDNCNGPETNHGSNFMALCSELRDKFNSASDTCHSADIGAPTCLDPRLAAVHFADKSLGVVVQRILEEERNQYLEEPSLEGSLPASPQNEGMVNQSPDDPKHQDVWRMSKNEDSRLIANLVPSEQRDIVSDLTPDILAEAEQLWTPNEGNAETEQILVNSEANGIASSEEPSRLSSWLPLPGVYGSKDRPGSLAIFPEPMDAQINLDPWL